MATSPSAVAAGIGWALAAGLMWGLAFIAAPLLPGYSALEIAAGRYAVYGLFSLGMLLIASRPGAVEGLREPAVWGRAFALTLVGNLLYFVAVTAGIQRAGPAIAALIIGTLPVLLAVAGNLTERTIRFSALVLPSALMLAGIAAVHFGEHGGLGASPGHIGYWVGIGLIVAALASWTWYGVANSAALKRRPDISAATWASLQGVTLLPIALPIIALSVVANESQSQRPSLALFLLVSLLLGIAASWIAMWCWNRACQLLPATMAGQLIVFETLAALVYTYAWKAAWPAALVVAGSVLLIVGVMIGVRRTMR